MVNMGVWDKYFVKARADCDAIARESHILHVVAAHDGELRNDAVMSRRLALRDRRGGEVLLPEAAPGDIEMQDGQLRGTPLMIASFAGLEVIVRLLISAGAGSDTTGVNHEYTNALMIASVQGNYEVVVKLFVDHHVDVNLRSTSDTDTALAMAITIGNEAGAEFNAKLTMDFTSLALVATFGRRVRQPATRSLQRSCSRLRKADLNAMEIHSQTPLAIAAYAGDKGTVQLLLNHSADELLDKHGRSPGLVISNLTTVVVPLVKTLYIRVVYEFSIDDAVMTILQTLRLLADL
ncbi:ankyrin repeat-containing domain protein [Trichoderma gracile]